MNGSTGLRFPFLVSAERYENEEMRCAVRHFEEALLSPVHGYSFLLVSGELFWSLKKGAGMRDDPVYTQVRDLLRQVWTNCALIEHRHRINTCDLRSIQPVLNAEFERTGLEAILQWHRWKSWHDASHPVKSIAGSPFDLESQHFKVIFGKGSKEYHELWVRAKGHGDNLLGACHSIHLELRLEGSDDFSLQKCFHESVLAILGLQFQMIPNGLKVTTAIPGSWMAFPKSVRSCSVEWVEAEPTRL